ncbi:MAG: DNA repair protein RecN [Halieaceae bacterium]|nr:DNA repair protein RecN [Halieaceae bacterium]
MLTHIHIKNFAVVEDVAIDFDTGMTVITGETGAGKSILIDALGLCLGDRADSGSVRYGEDKAEISASFDLHGLHEAQEWLAKHHFDSDDDLILRRIVTSEGRSKAYINGVPCTAQQCNELGEFLVDIHGQHAHQSLMNKKNHRHILDELIPDTTCLRKVYELAQDFRSVKKELDTLTQGETDTNDAKAFLEYQVEELQSVIVSADELESLEQEQDLLSQGETLIQQLSEASYHCEQQSDGLRQTIRLLESGLKSGLTSEAYELLNSALIQVDEARHDIERRSDKLELDPERLIEVTERLDKIYELARKHRTQPIQLAEKLQAFELELEALLSADKRIGELNRQLKDIRAVYGETAKTLSNQREAAGDRLQSEVHSQLQSLAMGNCRFGVALTPHLSDALSPYGAEEIEFKIATQSQGELKGLAKIASGGELSRISLAIQVVTAQQSVTPTLIFDEVDVGIGGATADIVGQRLHGLTSHSQILCVTHLAQVAGQGDHHLRISKTHDETDVRTVIQSLSNEQRIEEIARMVGGVNITEQTKAHAAQLLKQNS